MKSQRSFLKWPGNKLAVVPVLKPLLSNAKVLVEPFAGSGVVHINRPIEQHCIVADVNEDLINTFKFIQTKGEQFIAACKSLFNAVNNNAEMYYEIRRKYNLSRNAYDRAVYFVYLNKHSYRGLVRYNLTGEFNVPYGGYKRPYFPESEMNVFRYYSKNTEYLCSDFQTLLSAVQYEKGWAAYCDPPYLPLDGAKSNFTSYHGSFDVDDHKALASLAIEMSRSRDVLTIVSNHDSPLARSIYSGAEIRELEVARRMSNKSDSSVLAPEIIAIYRQDSHSECYFSL